MTREKEGITELVRSKPLRYSLLEWGSLRGVNNPKKANRLLSQLFRKNPHLIGDLTNVHEMNPSRTTMVVIPHLNFVVGIFGNHIRAFKAGIVCTERAIGAFPTMGSNSYGVFQSTDKLKDLAEEVYKHAMTQNPYDFNFEASYMAPQDYLTLVLWGNIKEKSDIMELHGKKWEQVTYNILQSNTQPSRRGWRKLFG